MAQISVARPRAEVLANDFVRSVYNWMAIGLSLTGFVAFYVSNNMAILRFVFKNFPKDGQLILGTVSTLGVEHDGVEYEFQRKYSVLSKAGYNDISEYFRPYFDGLLR